MSKMTPAQLKQWYRASTVGYGPDEGGYTFRAPPQALIHLACMAWSRPDPDYIPWIYGAAGGIYGPAFDNLRSPIYVFAPNMGHFTETEWPETFQDQGVKMVLIRDGRLQQTDQSCDCFGRLTDQQEGLNGTGTLVAPGILRHWRARLTGHELSAVSRHPLSTPQYWHYAEIDQKGIPYPDCTRCKGEGYIVSMGGEWALYAVKEKKA